MHSTVRRRFSELEKPSIVFNIVSWSPRISSTKREMFSRALDISSQIGTVAAFWCYLRSLAYISAPTTALLANFEPLTAVILGVLLLGLTLNAAELVGIALLAVMVFRLTHAKKK